MNYQKELEKILASLPEPQRTPRLLLHSCCAPCSSYVLEYLNRYFEITVFYYNPNIFPPEEYEKRVAEQRELISKMPFANPVRFRAGAYDRERFREAVRGLEHLREGGERCRRCFELRLRRAAELAAAEKFDYFTTTLTISPLKNAECLNELGMRIGDEFGVRYLVSDFKKKNGYQRSIELSREYGLYRQDYCGCEYSLSEAAQRRGSKRLSI